MSNVENSQILWGWNLDLDIPSALSRVERDQLVATYALITVVDSTPDISELSSLFPLLDTLDAFYETLGRSVVVESTTLIDLVRDHEFLNGFDEVWLFGEIPTEPKPDAVPLTSDVKLQQKPPGVLLSWMRSNGGFAGLGDGDGLNWLTSKPSLATLWGMEQPLSGG